MKYVINVKQTKIIEIRIICKGYGRHERGRILNDVFPYTKVFTICSLKTCKKKKKKKKEIVILGWTRMCVQATYFTCGSSNVALKPSVCISSTALRTQVYSLAQTNIVIKHLLSAGTVKDNPCVYNKYTQAHLPLFPRGQILLKSWWIKPWAYIGIGSTNTLVWRRGRTEAILCHYLLQKKTKNAGFSSITWEWIQSYWIDIKACSISSLM